MLSPSIAGCDPLPKYARKVDANQPEIVDALRRQGYSVMIVNGEVDLIVGANGLSLPVEIKAPGGRLRPSQERLLDEWRGSYLVTGDRGVDRALQDVAGWFALYVGRV